MYLLSMTVLRVYRLSSSVRFLRGASLISAPLSITMSLCGPCSTLPDETSPKHESLTHRLGYKPYNVLRKHCAFSEKYNKIKCRDITSPNKKDKVVHYYADKFNSPSQKRLSGLSSRIKEPIKVLSPKQVPSLPSKVNSCFT